MSDVASKDRIAERLVALQAEYETGQRMLVDLDTRRAALTSTLLRIEGAIQVLKEMSAAPEAAKPNGALRLEG
jgi:hypothetical protein